jgi:hypothetical protein
MNIRLGDKVKFMDELGGGIVVRMNSGIVTVEDEHGFEYDVAEDAVILDLEIDYGQVSEVEKAETYKMRARNAKKSEAQLDSKHHRDAKIPFLEVDLHIQHLISGNFELSNHEMVTMQMNYVKQMWSIARKNRYNKLVYIHGVGQGRLRQEIRDFLSDQSNCEYFDANIQTYGFGATEVKLWYN